MCGVHSRPLQHHMVESFGSRLEANLGVNIGCGNERSFRQPSGQQITEHRAGVRVRHVILARHNHQRATMILYECFEHLDAVTAQIFRINVAENDHVKLQPFGVTGGQSIGVTIVECSQGRCAA